MAREWRRAVFAALAAAMLGGICVLSAQFGARAYAANEDAEEEQDQSPAGDAQPKGGKKRQDPAEAQRAIDAALKQVQAGRAEQAVQAMTATLSAGNLPPALMAKALYVRGLAYRRQGRPAQAISDINSALWLKGGLDSEDRVEATNERSAAYADAGLGGRGGESEAPASKAPAPKTGGSWLSALFGSSTPASQPPAPARQAPPPPARVEAPPAAKPPTAVSSGWSSRTEVQADRSALAAAAPPAPPPPRAAPPPAPVGPTPAAGTEGRYLVQLASVRTEAEARALAAKAKREPALASRQAAIDHAVVGNMGAFYRVRFGPFASAQETEAVCTRLQGSGFDCLPVGP
jgi:cell division septation protein DedD